MTERTHADARAGIPMNADQVRASIAKMERAKASLAARKAMAKLAVKHGNFTDEGRKVWADYLESLD